MFLTLRNADRPFPSYLVSLSETVLVQNHLYENKFDLHDTESVGRMHFHMSDHFHDDLPQVFHAVQPSPLAAVTESLTTITFQFA